MSEPDARRGCLATFAGCGHVQHYDGAVRPGMWLSGWGPRKTGCQTQCRVQFVRLCPGAPGCPDCAALEARAAELAEHRQGAAVPGPDARLGAEVVSSRKTLVHVVALRELAIGRPFPRTVPVGAPLCPASGNFPAPEAGLFPPEITCANCSVEARLLGLSIETPDSIA